MARDERRTDEATSGSEEAGDALAVAGVAGGGASTASAPAGRDGGGGRAGGEDVGTLAWLAAVAPETAPATDTDADAPVTPPPAPSGPRPLDAGSWAVVACGAACVAAFGTAIGLAAGAGWPAPAAGAVVGVLFFLFLVGCGAAAQWACEESPWVAARWACSAQTWALLTLAPLIVLVPLVGAALAVLVGSSTGSPEAAGRADAGFDPYATAFPSAVPRPTIRRASGSVVEDGLLRYRLVADCPSDTDRSCTPVVAIEVPNPPGTAIRVEGGVLRIDRVEADGTRRIRTVVLDASRIARLFGRDHVEVDPEVRVLPPGAEANPAAPGAPPTSLTATPTANPQLAPTPVSGPILRSP